MKAGRDRLSNENSVNSVLQRPKPIRFTLSMTWDQFPGFTWFELVCHLRCPLKPFASLPQTTQCLARSLWRMIFSLGVLPGTVVDFGVDVAFGSEDGTLRKSRPTTSRSSSRGRSSACAKVISPGRTSSSRLIESSVTAFRHTLMFGVSEEAASRSGGDRGCMPTVGAGGGGETNFLSTLRFFCFVLFDG